jgi:type IV secretory pathway VirB9-like protein
MKTLSILLISSGLAVGAVTTSLAATTPDAPHTLLPSAPRTVVVRETETPPLIRAGLLQSTLILLPAEEKVATVFGGDTVSWVFDGGHVASRFISIKPKVANTTTDVHIVSDHGNEYTLQLREVSSDGDPHFDSKVFVTPGDQAGKDKLAAMPVFVPAAEETKAEQDRSQYPGQLHFDYTWNEKKGNALGLQQVWRDEKFTYLRGHFQETPALYELKDGKGSLINFDYNDGLYTIPKTVADGYLTIGKQRVEFKRAGGN